MKIGFFEIDSSEEEILKKAFLDDELLFVNYSLSDQILNSENASEFKDLEIISVFVHSKVDKKVLQNMPNLKLVTTRSVGFDHIDLKACHDRGIQVCYVPNYGKNTVAEHTFALILALSRKIVESVNRTRKGNFDITGLCGFDLKYKVLGVVGTGNIGKYVIKIANGFGMKVLAFDVCKDAELEKDGNFSYVSLQELLEKSDIVTLHVPHCEGTHHLIDDEKFDIMRKNAIIINTSRGGIIDTEALVRALKAKKIAGAGLDVLEGECDLIEERELENRDFKSKCDTKILEENRVLLSMPNVIITPHNAFNTCEALERILNATIDNINGFKQGKLINLVKKF
ncbi:MAG: hydroxyacid dehydrogenase [candidate division TM6 bacterium GW2011_GWF2_30_66]|nr:MAG: hydroxyacid dehydrogenase [candidate division TM6 bacterium GW2011_GWF2_30_66]